jgi:alanyl-tRNA synthetase
MRSLIEIACRLAEGKGGGRAEVCEGGGKKAGRAEEALAAAVELLKRMLAGSE